jgi:ACS family D-galactonate transporter-like MFS transporter
MAGAPNARFASQPDAAPTNVRYQVVAWLTLAAAIAYLTRNAVSVAESTIREDLGLSLRQSGWFMGTFFWSYALLQIPGGELAHRRGAKLAMVLFTAAGSVATLCIGLAPGLWLLLTAQLIMGAAQAGLFPASCYSISHWIPLARRTFACGILTMGMQVGAIAASILTGRFIENIPWRWVFLIYALPGIVWAIAFLMKFRDRPQNDPSVNAAELQLISPVPQDSHSRSENRSAPWGAIVANPAIWFLCGQQICRGAGYMFFASWFPTFLQATRGVSVVGSGYLQALVFSGTMAGCIIGGWLTDWILNRTGSLRYSRSGVGSTFLFGCSMLILAAWFVESTTVAVGLLAAGALFAALAGPCAFSATMDIGGDHVPQVFGLMNMTGNLAAAACPILVAELFEWTSNWGLVLLVFSGIYLAGAISWAFVDCSRKVEHEVSNADKEHVT